MAHNFIEQLNLVADNTGNTFLASTMGFSVDGSDLNSGTDPNLPKQNLVSGSVTQAIAVLGSDQTYDDLPSGNRNYIGDGMAIIDGGGVRGVTQSNLQPIGGRNLYIRNFISSGGASTTSLIIAQALFKFDNCIFEANDNLRIYNIAAPLAFVNSGNFIKNSLYSFAPAGNVVSAWVRSIFYAPGAKQTLEINDSSTVIPDKEQVWHSNVFINFEIVCTQAQIELFENNYIDGTTSFIIDGTPYADLTSLQSAIPLSCPNSITSGADFKGSLDRNEFRSVAVTSSLLGGGKNGVNIGNVNEGLVFNEANVQSSINITFVGGNITLTNPLLDGQIIWEDSFSKVVRNPFLRLNGVQDFLNNIIKTIQVPDPEKPRKATVQIETKDKFTPYETIQVFRTGYEIGEDANGLFSGQEDYHEFGLQSLRVFSVRITMTVKS